MKNRVPQKTIRPFGTQYAVMVLLCGVWVAAACYVFIAIFSTGFNSNWFEGPLVLQLVWDFFGAVLATVIAVFLLFLLLRAKVTFYTDYFEIVPLHKVYRLPPKKRNSLKAKLLKPKQIKYSELRLFGAYSNKEIALMLKKQNLLQTVKITSGAGGIPVSAYLPTKAFGAGQALLFVTANGTAVIDDSQYSLKQVQNIFYELQKRTGIGPGGYVPARQNRTPAILLGLESVAKAIFFAFLPLLMLTGIFLVKQQPLNGVAGFAAVIMPYAANGALAAAQSLKRFQKTVGHGRTAKLCKWLFAAAVVLYAGSIALYVWLSV